MPDISVIIPAYREEKVIAKLVQKRMPLQNHFRAGCCTCWRKQSNFFDGRSIYYQTNTKHLLKYYVNESGHEKTSHRYSDVQ